MAERLDGLAGGRIRFTPAMAFNDPFELKPFFDELVTEDELAIQWENNPLDLTPYLEEAYSKAPEIHSLITRDQMIAFARATLESPEGQRMFGETWQMIMDAVRQLTPDFRTRIHDALRSRIGILCFSEEPANMLMWSHYSDEHRGVVLCFDQQHAFFDRRRSPQDDFFHLKQVVYREPVPRPSLLTVQDADIFISKRPEWSYEKEWRMLAPLDNADFVVKTVSGDVHLFDFPPMAVHGVILGARSSADVESRFRSLLETDSRYSHVKLHRATLDERSQKIRVPNDA